jgi:predicted nuclease of predicted toxin-antitoxin system
MNVLLDERIPRKLKNSLAGHDCRTAPEVGVAGRKNGEVLSVAERLGFDIFVTMDKGVEYEQNLAGRKIAIIILRSRSNRLVDLLPHVPACLALMGSIQPGQVERLGE